MGDNTSIYPVSMSYAFKLLLEELKSLGIVARLRLEDLSWGKWFQRKSEKSILL